MSGGEAGPNRVVASPVAGRTGPVLVVGDVIDDVIVRPLETVTRDSDTRSHIVRREGGSPANLACWLAQAGAPVTFVGRVGHADVERHAGALFACGVEPRLIGDPHTQTGVIMILLEGDGGRTMFTDRGANLNLVSADVPPGLIEQAALLHLSGYSFFEEGVRAAAESLLTRARTAGVPVSIDPGSEAFLDDVGPANFLAWTSGAQLFFPNLGEARVLTGLDDPAAAARRLSRHYDVVAVTCGSKGAVIASGGDIVGFVEADRVNEVDPTGAGDSFSAGFIAAALYDQADPASAARAGMRLALQAISQMGARPVSREEPQHPNGPTPDS